ncbi:MAG: DUF4274 domain-containing protein [Pseudomonadota bacterium]
MADTLNARAMTGRVMVRQEQLKGVLNRLGLARGQSLVPGGAAEGYFETGEQEPPQVADRKRWLEWKSSEPVFDLNAVDPDSAKGHVFLTDLDADTLHEIALKYNRDLGLAWLVAIIKHPACDFATAWTVFFRSHPYWFEEQAREGGGVEALHPFYKDDVTLLSVAHQRLAAVDFASRRFCYEEDHPPGNIRLVQQDLISAGHNLIWEIPDGSFLETADRPHRPKLELVDGHLMMMPFDKWCVSAA